MRDDKGIVISNELIASDTYKMIIESNLPSEMNPGQFVNIKVNGFILRRPISICSIDDGSYTIIYKVVGEGTEVLAQCKKDDIIDVIGPCGSGYPIHNELKEVILVGGGVGVPPLYEVAKRYINNKTKVIVVLGFNDKDSVFYKDEFEELGCNVYVATMDGSYGFKGTVIDAIDHNVIETEFLYSCGPMPMLKALEQKYKQGYTSFESRMACGIGVCNGCVCKDSKDKEVYHRICKEGPVFKIGTVDF